MTETCGHTFCQDCLLQHVCRKLRRNNSVCRKLVATMLRLNENVYNWSCPECRTVQTRQPDELIRNRLVERAVESFNAAPAQNQANNLCSHHNLEQSLCKFNICFEEETKFASELTIIHGLYFQTAYRMRKSIAFNVTTKKCVMADNLTIAIRCPSLNMKGL